MKTMRSGYSGKLIYTVSAANKVAAIENLGATQVRDPTTVAVAALVQIFNFLQVQLQSSVRKAPITMTLHDKSHMISSAAIL